MFISVPPGQSFHYRLAIPTDHPVGTYWYHSHAMPPPTGSGFTPGLVETQIFAGLSGAIVIGDNRRLLPPALRHVRAHTMVLKDAQIDASGSIVQNTDTVQIDSNAPTARLVNGHLRPVLPIRAGETQLWRLVNAGADIFYQLAFDGHRFTVVGQDGVPVAQVSHPSTLLLPPGKRYDVLIRADDPGSFSLRSTAYSNGPGGDSYPDVALMSVHVEGHSHPQPPIAVTSLLEAPQDLAGTPIAQHRAVTLTEDEKNQNHQFFINGKLFDMDRSVFSTPARVSTVEEWTIVNQTAEDHPFHVHNVSFQVTSIDGVPQPFAGYQDTVPVPHQENGRPGQVVIRVPYGPYPGRYMFHCHIAAHEDNGMMSFVEVIDPHAQSAGHPQQGTTLLVDTATNSPLLAGQGSADRLLSFVCYDQHRGVAPGGGT
jgi:FtsP/CotA-like multicopper oxidase with cupredoxin domain